MSSLLGNVLLPSRCEWLWCQVRSAASKVISGLFNVDLFTRVSVCLPSEQKRFLFALTAIVVSASLLARFAYLWEMNVVDKFTGGVRLQIGLLSLLAISLAANASDGAALYDDVLEAQLTQAELQARIDSTDDEVRARLDALRQAREELRRLTAYNAELAPQVEGQAKTLERRLAALDSLNGTREALPGLMRRLLERLRLWVEADMPYLKQERMARVGSLESMLANAELGRAEKFERVLAAWRSELDYGLEFDAWRGELRVSQSGAARDVEFLRVGRVGWYYVTPDGSEGGVWKVEQARWQQLDSDGIAEVRKGLDIVREQRPPTLLNLPLSQPSSQFVAEEHRS